MKHSASIQQAFSKHSASIQQAFSKHSASILLFFLVTVFTLSCERENVVELPAKASSDIPLEIRPKVIDGVLTFNDGEQFNKYYEFLDRVTDESDDEDSILAVFEKELGYVSYRSTMPLEFGDMEEYRNLNRFPDPIMSSISNSNYTFGVGDKLSIARKDEDYLVDKSNTRVVRKLSSIPFDGKLSFDDFTNDIEITRSDDSHQVFTTIGKVASRDRCDLIIDIARRKPVCKNAFTYDLTVTAFDLTRIGTIDWGDGTSVSFNTALPGLSHTYTSGGSYTIKVYVESAFGCPAVRENFDVKAGKNGICIFDPRSAEKTMDDNNSPLGKWKFELEVFSSSNVSNGGFIWHNRVRAISTSFRRKKNGKYKKRRAWHNLRVNSIFRNVECKSMANETKASGWKKKRRVKLKVNAGPSFIFHKTGDTKAWFRGKSCEGCPEFNEKLEVEYSCK